MHSQNHTWNSVLQQQKTTFGVCWVLLVWARQYQKTLCVLQSKRDEKHTTKTTQIQNHLYCTDHFLQRFCEGSYKGYLLIPESQLSLNKEGEAESSSWSASCLNRLPGWKRSGFSAFVDGGVCRRREKAAIINNLVRDTNIHQLPAVSTTTP